MKKRILFSLTAVAVTAMVMVACKKNFNNSGFESRGTFAGPYVDTVTLPLIIDQDRVLTTDTLYLLNGKTYVTNGANLFIDAGSRIEGVPKPGRPDSASTLVITRNSTITAEGDVNNPIIFTSHAASPAPGDWGGVVILGNAPLNRGDTTIEGIGEPNLPVGVDINYGGGTPCNQTNAGESSGSLRYVVIEYAGAVISEGNELNGLTMGGVGSGTLIDFVEVAYGADDGFEFFGGTVNCYHLISYGNNDDDFDFDFGYSGVIQWAVGSKVPDVAYSPNPNGVESDNNPGASFAGCDTTEAGLFNVTIIGTNDSTEAVALPAGGGKGLLNGMFFRQHSTMRVRNSVVMDYPTGIRTATTLASNQAVDSILNTGVHAFQAITNGFALGASNTPAVRNAAVGNNYMLLVAPYNVAPARPNYLLQSSSPLLGTAVWPTVYDARVTKVTYRGAFDNSTDWTLGWAVFN